MSEKTAELVKEGAEKTAAAVTYTTRLTQLNLEKGKVEKSMDEAWTDLGRMFYELQSENKLHDLESAARETLMPKLADLEQRLQELESQKQALQKSQGEDYVDKASVKELTNELQAHGGTIRQVTISADSGIVGKKLKEVKLPKEALIGTIVRGEQVIIPDGNTVFAAEDKITFLGKLQDVEQAIAGIAGN